MACFESKCRMLIQEAFILYTNFMNPSSTAGGSFIMCSLTLNLKIWFKNKHFCQKMDICSFTSSNNLENCMNIAYRILSSSGPGPFWFWSLCHPIGHSKHLEKKKSLKISKCGYSRVIVTCSGALIWGDQSM